MGRLIVLRRPGIVVVSGLVEEAFADEVLISNDTFADGVSDTKKIRLGFETGTLQKMHLSKGTFIIASAADDFRIEMMLEGGRIPDKEIQLRGFIPRFNGSFDFEKHGREKEAHVFSGNVLSSQKGSSGDKFWERITMGWKRNGKDEIRTVINWGRPIDGERGQRVILVTGEKKLAQQGMTYYNALRCIT